MFALCPYRLSARAISKPRTDNAAFIGVDTMRPDRARDGDQSRAGDGDQSRTGDGSWSRTGDGDQSRTGDGSWSRTGTGTEAGQEMGSSTGQDRERRRIWQPETEDATQCQTVEMAKAPGRCVDATSATKQKYRYRDGGITEIGIVAL